MPWKGSILEETTVASAARTTAGSAISGETYDAVDVARVQLEITAVAGVAPELTVFIEDSVDGTNWNTIGAFTAKAVVAREAITVSNIIGRNLRVRWNITGTAPSFTFSVKLAAEA